MTIAGRCRFLNISFDVIIADCNFFNFQILWIDNKFLSTTTFYLTESIGMSFNFNSNKILIWNFKTLNRMFLTDKTYKVLMNSLSRNLDIQSEILLGD